MSIAVVSSAANKLGQLLTDEAGFLYDVNEQFTTLQKKLTTMQSYLEDVDAKQETNASIRNWVADVRETAYDAEDTIKTYIIEANDQSPHMSTGVIYAFFSNCFGFLPKLIILHKVGMDIKKILIRIDGINHRLSTYNIMANVGGGHDQASTEISRRRQLSRQSYPPDEDDKDVIGLEEHITSLVNELTTRVNNSKTDHIVSIIGVGGLGKTTLAKKVYNHETVKEHFKYRAWVFVSHEQFSVSAILKEIGTQVGAPAQETGSVENQIRKLKVYLRYRQYLVVLDDIWREEDWFLIKHALPLSHGSKILLTTRTSSVASPDFTLEPRLLNEKESWELFRKKATRGAINSISGNFEMLGREMVGKCGGLPLPIVVLGGLLSTKLSINDWEVVSRNYLLNKSESEVFKILSLSYDDLPYHLKPCFLYLGIFPNTSCEISTKQLINMWIAEGFIQEEEESVGEQLLHELIDRCIVQKGKLSVTGKVKTCRLHDLIRNMCLRKAEEENFYHHGRNRPPMLASPSLNYPQLRRYACLFDKVDDCYYFFDQYSFPHLRTLLVIIQPPYGEGTRYTRNIFQKYKLLSVLVLDGDNAHLADVGCLFHLRYLGLIRMKLEELPASIGNLRNLQTLDLRRSSVSFIPNTIWKMKQLRHLYLNDSSKSKIKDGPLGIGDLRNLKTLNCISAGDWIKETDLLNLTNICELGIRDLSRSQVKVVIGSIVKPSSSSSSSNNCLLGSLSLKLSNPYEGFPKLEPLTHCSGLSKLTLNGVITDTKLQFFPSYLTKLSLTNSQLGYDPMKTLQDLENLVCLRLCSAYVGEHMVCDAKGFPRLQFLLLSTLQGLEEWTVEKGGMPCLRELSTRTCRKLKMLPEGLWSVTTLTKLEMIDMGTEFYEWVREGGEFIERVKEGGDWYKIKHVPSVKVVADKDDDKGLGFRRKLIKAVKQKQVQEEGQGGESLMMGGFNILPEGCISTILSFTSPRDVIRLSLVSTTFKSASELDSVWDNLLPSIYPEIISRSSYSSSSMATTSTSLLGGFSSKKDLCCNLLDKVIIIDGGSKSFGLEKESGKICFMLGTRALSIIWGSTPRYWRWRPDDESRFPVVAELLDVCWMEITGKVETRILSPKTMYGAYFVMKTTEQTYGLDSFPVQFSMRFVGGGGECSEARRVFLKREDMQQQQQEEFPRERGDGWMEIEMGEFYKDGEEDEEVEMHLLETGGHWKCGLIVQGMELRPKVTT